MRFRFKRVRKLPKFYYCCEEIPFFDLFVGYCRASLLLTSKGEMREKTLSEIILNKLRNGYIKWKAI